MEVEKLALKALAVQLLDRRRMAGIVSALGAGGQNSLLSALAYRAVDGLVNCTSTDEHVLECGPAAFSAACIRRKQPAVCNFLGLSAPQGNRSIQVSTLVLPAVSADS